MQQRQARRLAFLVGAGSLAAGALFVIACSTDNGSPVPTPQVDGATGKETGPGNEGGPGPEGGGGDAGPDADCSKNPTLRDVTNGYRCSFFRSDGGGVDGGSTSNCTNTETCCNPADKIGSDFAPSFCATGTTAAKGTPNPTVCKDQAAANASSFDAGTIWECADKNACDTGEICCLIQDPARLALDPAKNKLNIGNTPASDKNHPPACKVQRSYNEGGSRCRMPNAGNCSAGEIKLCSLSDDNCGAGTTCTPFVDFANTFRGFCK